LTVRDHPDIRIGRRISVKKIAITTSSFGKYDRRPLQFLEKKDLEIMLNPYGRKLNKSEVIDICNGAAGIIAGTEKLDAEVMGKLADLEVISRCGAGLDNVDRDTARVKGIKVFNTPEAPVLSVSELTVALILNLLRKVIRMDAAVRKDEWGKMMGNLLCGKKAGIIGFGRIGKKVAELLNSFGCEIAYTDPAVENEFTDMKRMSLSDLLGWSNIVTLHVSGDGMVLGKKELQLMKKGAWLVNVSRGGTVDENALYEALKEGRLAGAALDVFEKEPYDGPLSQLNNVILTPHVGSYAKEARVEMEIEAVENLLEGLGLPQ